MNSKDFEGVINRQIQVCQDVLINKAKEYATEDRLHNFKNAAGMMGCDPKEALAGMMAKHTISIYDMCRDGKEHPIELWQEKITDHINYLLLLKALVAEEEESNQYRTAKIIADNRIYGITMAKSSPTVKPDLAERILNMSEQIRRCADADCEGCPYNNSRNGEECPKLFVSDFEKLITDILNEERKTNAN